MITLQQRQITEPTRLEGEVCRSMGLAPHLVTQYQRIVVQQRGQVAANPGREVRHRKYCICNTLTVSVGWWRQRLVGTVHSERDVPLSTALVPYRGDVDAQRRDLALEQQQIPHTREGDTSSSVAHVQSRGDTQPPRLAIQLQEQEAANPECGVRHLPSRELLVSVG